MTDETTNPIRDAIQSAIDDHEVILFMKGTPDAPACGFSARTVGALQALGAPFAAVDILPDPRIREELSAISAWPTIPQLFVKGELVGGCDIVTEMYEAGELAQSGQPRQRLALELPDTLARQVELMADRLERPGLALEPEPELENAPLPFGECIERLADVLLAQRLLGLVERIGRFAVGKEIAELTLVVCADGLVQRD